MKKKANALRLPLRKMKKKLLDQRMRALSKFGFVVFKDDGTFTTSLDEVEIGLLNDFGLGKLDEGISPKQFIVGHEIVDSVSLIDLVEFWIKHHPKDLDSDRARWDPEFKAYHEKWLSGMETK